MSSFLSFVGGREALGDSGIGFESTVDSDKGFSINFTSAMVSGSARSVACPSATLHAVNVLSNEFLCLTSALRPW